MVPAGDVDFFARAAHAGLVFAIVDGVLLRKRFHGGGVSAAPDMHGSLLQALRASIERQRA